jgi:hypothetical protein
MELSSVGCFKSDGGSGYIPCIGQADATANALLSVWSYQARNTATGLPCIVEIRDGYLLVDSNISSSLNHQAFAVGAPQIPAYLGGSIVQFDAYLAYYAGKQLGATSPAAKLLDPLGLGGTAASELRIYIYYPAATQNTHVLRLVTYRQSGTF